jgi:hypothetical protein
MRTNSSNVISNKNDSFANGNNNINVNSNNFGAKENYMPMSFYPNELSLFINCSGMKKGMNQQQGYYDRNNVMMNNGKSFHLHRLFCS